MELWRKMGVVIIFGIVAIIGGGFAWVLSEDWAVVFTFLGVIAFCLLAFLLNPEQMVNQMGEKKESEEH